VGASTVAAALHADEHGERAAAARPAGAGDAQDVIVCAGDQSSLRRAEGAPPATVLLVVLVDDDPPPTRARQRELGRRHGLVVVLPHVRAWAGLARVPADAAALLASPPDQLPPTLRAYARGLRLAVAALLQAPPARRTHAAAYPGSPGGLTPSAPPTSARPARAAMLTGPVAGWPTPVASTPAPVLDDDALEAEVLAAVRPRVRAVHRPVMGPIATAKAG
jgi:hypothetical protein